MVRCSEGGERVKLISTIQWILIAIMALAIIVSEMVYGVQVPMSMKVLLVLCVILTIEW